MARPWVAMSAELEQWVCARQHGCSPTEARPVSYADTCSGSIRTMHSHQSLLTSEWSSSVMMSVTGGSTEDTMVDGRPLLRHARLQFSTCEDAAARAPYYSIDGGLGMSWLFNGAACCCAVAALD